MFRRPGSALLLLAAALLLAACAPAIPGPTPTPETPTPPSLVTPTATIVWFPATETPTPFVLPTATPTQEMRPDVGAALLEDDFSQPRAWRTGKGEAGSVAVADGALSLAIAQPGASLASLRPEPALTDFYMEITAQTSLCLEMDSYGVLLRAGEDQSYYRLALSCNGQVRLERVLRGQAAVLENWSPSGQVPPGAPGKVRIGVWVRGKELRVFLDGIYQFSASDPVLTGGSLGVFARSAGKNAVSVSFSDLEVDQLAGP